MCRFLIIQSGPGLRRMTNGYTRILRKTVSESSARNLLSLLLLLLLLLLLITSFMQCVTII